ncbi:tRNA (uridine(54)-C5)-methyltransferase TrmA [Malaciobacter pacificus]|uniref:tRNA m5U54 methyltransferase n=1 Tax=Malaciobacter pacificus TaxID=1080223 RepID=A0A5C2HB94_9BACT|nr:tRNA (uridine(54)-C5)-methyltransferase TrmA [Malaciobacter pacificus]QEP35498.1 tRNA m5U54 methyltransferase [Malaciobacter pacificus]
MDCKYFGKCASCVLHDMNYEEQLNHKIKREKERFSDLTTMEFDIIKSEEEHFRNRAEFRIWKNFDNEDNLTLSYAMNGYDKNVVEINECKIVSSHISDVMPKLLDKIQNDQTLSFKIFSIEFLGSTIDDLLVTMIYHRKLDSTWIEKAKELEKELNIKIIGRSRKQKEILSVDYINEELEIDGRNYKFAYEEGGFTQPNTKVNIKMIEWVLENTSESSSDLCELYCGGGNFTIPLSTKFNKVLATEISKTSIKSALRNCSLNEIDNIEFIRMSAEEFTEALEFKRDFRRLKDVDLKSYDFDTIFMDPPRAGLDDITRDLGKDFNKIIYISCNPETLHRDLQELTKTHKIVRFALFDQFSYTNHIESGVVLEKR